MSSFDCQVENSGRTVQYKLNAQSLRLFGLHRDVNDAHRASANRLQNKQTSRFVLMSKPRPSTTHDRHCVLFVCPTLLANLCLCVVEAVDEVVTT